MSHNLSLIREHPNFIGENSKSDNTAVHLCNGEITKGTVPL